MALGVLSVMSAEALALAVATGDADGFKGAPGVGTRIANRIVMELKGKLDGGLVIHAEAMGDGDIVEALTALGYTAYEAREAASSLAPGDKMPLEDRVRLALQRMGGA